LNPILNPTCAEEPRSAALILFRDRRSIHFHVVSRRAVRVRAPDDVDFSGAGNERPTDLEKQPARQAAAHWRGSPAGVRGRIGVFWVCRQSSVINGLLAIPQEELK
jgi:hypothetical protein